MNTKLPIDGPMFRVYYQSYRPTDFDTSLPESLRPQGLLIWKSHHGLGDGMSIMCMVLAMSTHYDKSMFLKPYTRTTPWWQAMLLRLSFPLYVPGILATTFFAKQDKNYITQRKLENRLSGV
jgi:hypothetical protein